MQLRELSGDVEFEPALEVIKASFRTVAEEFGANPQTWPWHSAFMTAARLCEILAEGLRLFAIYKDNLMVGVVGIRDLGEGRFSLEKLAVLPQWRHGGYGRRLVQFVCNFALQAGGKVVELGMIDEHTILKQWYIEQGFTAVKVWQPEGYPFSICKMEKYL
jgi:diamine N-acetyltransferase